jgi:thiosulfate/3-mercaptopyruvate sulfurtransferase
MVFSAISLLALLAPVARASDSSPVRTSMLVSTEWLAAHRSDSNLVVLCIASDESFYNKGHIPGARLVRLSEITTVRDSIPNELPSAQMLQSVFEQAGVANDSRIVLYGERSGLLAARAYFTLDYLGLAGNAALLDGGIEKWRSEQRPESKRTPAIDKHELNVSLNPSLLVNTGELKTILANAHNKFSLIDSRPRSEYTGETLSQDLSHGGHIPGAKHLYWKALLVDSDVPVLKPVSELEALLENAGADHSGTVISYCRSGMQSSMNYFVAKYLGYTSRMYDASFYEWSRKNLPVEESKRQ